MADVQKNTVFSGKTKDVLLVIEHLATQMTEHQLREAEVVLPFSDGNATIRLKR